MLIHPTVERLRDIGLSAMADALVEMQSNPDAAELPHADWLGLLVDREATARDNRRLSRRLHTAKLRQTAVVENVDLRSSRGLDRAVQGALHQRLGSRAPAPRHHGADRHGQKLAGLCARPQGLPRRFLGYLQARTAPLRRPRSGPRRGAAQSLHDDDRTRQPRHHRRLGPRAAERGSAARSAGNRRPPLRSGLPADHQPSPRVLLARHHRDPTLGDAILDRVLHTAHRIELKGDSLRRQAAAAKSPA